MFSGKIHAGWLIDGSGGPAIRDVMIDIREGLIQSVGPPGKGPNSAEGVIDLTDGTLLPGLVDSHVHLCLPESGVSAHSDVSAEDDNAENVARITRRLGRYLSHGIMAVRDGGDRLEKVLRYNNSPPSWEVPKVAVYTPGGAFFKKGRYGGFIGKEIVDGKMLSGAVKAQAPRVDHIKILNSGINSLTQYGRETPSQFTPAQLRKVVSMAARFNRRVMVHANGRGPVGDAIEAGCRSIEHGYFMGKENLLKMRDKGVIWVPTAIPMKAYADLLEPGTAESDIARRTLDHQLQQMTLARELGVVLAAGSDAGSPGVAHGAGLIGELKLFRIAGYSIEEAIRCASVNGTALINFRLSGRIETGTRVALVAVPGAPDRLPESLTKVRRILVTDDPPGTEHP